MIIEHNLSNNIWDIIDMGPGRYDWKFFLTSSFNVMYYYNEKKNQSGQIKYFLKLNNFFYYLLKIIKR